MKGYSAQLRTFCLAACAASAFFLASAPIAPAQGVYFGPPYYSQRYYYSGDGIGFYLAGDLGITVMQDFNSSRFGFPGKFSTDPGVRFSVEPGFDFLATDFFTMGAEFETGSMYNYVSSVSNTGASTGLHGDYYQVPFLANLVFKFHPDPFFVPYFGLGGGGVYSSARIHFGDYFGYYSSSYSDQTDAAVQAMAGFRFRINAMVEVGVGYKFLAANPGAYDHIITHSVSATVSLNF